MPHATLQFEMRGTAPPPNRRRVPRSPAEMELWLIPGLGQPLVRCRCTNVSSGGVALRAAGRPHLRPGQHCELCTHLPGGSPPASECGFTSRGGTIVRAQVAEDDPEFVELGVALDAWNAADDE